MLLGCHGCHAVLSAAHTVTPFGTVMPFFHAPQVAEMPGSAGCHVVLDAAHTADSAAALASTLRDAFPDQPVALVLAMAGDKQHRWVQHLKVWKAMSLLAVLAVCRLKQCSAAGHLLWCW
jgi:hypothetical protein